MGNCLLLALFVFILHFEIHYKIVYIMWLLHLAMVFATRFPFIPILVPILKIYTVHSCVDSLTPLFSVALFFYVVGGCQWNISFGCSFISIVRWLPKSFTFESACYICLHTSFSLISVLLNRCCVVRWQHCLHCFLICHDYFYWLPKFLCRMYVCPRYWSCMFWFCYFYQFDYSTNSIYYKNRLK